MIMMTVIVVVVSDIIRKESEQLYSLKQWIYYVW